MKRLALFLALFAIVFLPLAGCSDIKDELKEAAREKQFQAVKDLGEAARKGIDEGADAAADAASDGLSGDGDEDEDSEEDGGY